MSCSTKFEWNNLLLGVTLSNNNPNKSENIRCSDTRSIFKMDFDRVCRSSSFRRLQDKAQVFPLKRGDYLRTRLTHSIEVMAIAESLGDYAIQIILSKEGKDADNIENLHEIPTILRTASLLHDLGNPPFGHISEDLIRTWFQNNRDNIRCNKGFGDKSSCPFKEYLLKNKISDKKIGLFSDSYISDFLKFDGNAQVLRIATHLHNTGMGNTGMNLSLPVLATIIKYPESADNDQHQKVGFFKSEEDVYREIQDKLKLNNRRHPLVYLLEASDDIAYLISDLEDAVQKDLLTSEDIGNELYSVLSDEFWKYMNLGINKKFMSKMNEAYYLAQELESIVKSEIDENKRLNCRAKIPVNIWKVIFNKFFEYVIGMKDKSEDLSNLLFLFEAIDKYNKFIESNSKSKRDSESIRKILLHYRGMLIEGAKTGFEKEYSKIMNGELGDTNLIEIGPCAKLTAVLRIILNKYLYYCPEIIETKIRVCKIIPSMLDHFSNCMLHGELDVRKDTVEYISYLLVSSNFRDVEESSLNKFKRDISKGVTMKPEDICGGCIYRKLQLILDFISGMTDSYATEIYENITAMH